MNNLNMHILKQQKRNNKRKNKKNRNYLNRKYKIQRVNISKKWHQLKNNMKIKQIQQKNINQKLLIIQE